MARSRREILGWIAVAVFAVVNLGLFLMPRRSLPTNAVEVTDKRLPPADREQEIQRQLDGVKKYDKEISDRLDLPADEIEKASSFKLLDHFVNSSMRSWLGLYNDTNVGVRRAIQGSTTLNALIQRPDIMDAFVEWNRHCVEEVNKLQSDSQDGGQLSNSIMACDDLLGFPSIFQKTKGHERALLQAVCRRYRAMVEANSLFDDDNKPFGAVFNGTRTNIVALAKVIDPNGAWDTGDEAELVSRAESLVK